MIQVVLYTRPGCGLCEDVKSTLQELQSEIPHNLREVDIESDADLLARYAEQIPVVKIGPYTLEAPIERVDLEIALRAAVTSTQLSRDAEPNLSRSSALSLNRGLLFFARHWLAIFNLIVFAYVALPFGA
ncbi:MAG: glutaredoxin family protein, partial [Anaerolineales bacterium]